MTSPTLISSQRYIDDGTVGAKRKAADYCVTVFPLDHAGTQYLLVIDGHHSLAAAKLDGVEPEIKQADGELLRQLAGELEYLGVEAFLLQHYSDSPYYDVRTGREVF